jgi:hypothetical protein
MARMEVASAAAIATNNINSNTSNLQQQQPQQQPQQQAVASSGGGGTPAAAVNGNNQNGSNAPGGSSNSTTTIISSANSIFRPIGVTNGSEGSVLQLQLLHDPGVTADWSSEEQSILDDGLTKFASETSNLSKYIKITTLLPEKTVRDIALRCRWMTKKEIGKRRKPEDQNASKKNKEKKDKSDPVNKASQNHMRPGGLPTYVPPPPPVDNDDGISNDAIGGPTGQLLEQNSKIIVQIRANLAACKLTENTEHLVRFRDNIFAILNGYVISYFC